MSLVFFLVTNSLKWQENEDPIALFWKYEDFNDWVYKIGDIHEAFKVYECTRKEDGTLEIRRRH